VNVRSALVICIDNDFVHQLDQLIVRGQRNVITTPATFLVGFLAHVRQQITDTTGVG
jgi:hypothetical protein